MSLQNNLPDLQSPSNSSLSLTPTQHRKSIELQKNSPDILDQTVLAMSQPQTPLNQSPPIEKTLDSQPNLQQSPQSQHSAIPQHPTNFARRQSFPRLDSNLGGPVGFGQQQFTPEQHVQHIPLSQTFAPGNANFLHGQSAEQIIQHPNNQVTEFAKTIKAQFMTALKADEEAEQVRLKRSGILFEAFDPVTQPQSSQNTIPNAAADDAVLPGLSVPKAPYYQYISKRYNGKAIPLLLVVSLCWILLFIYDMIVLSPVLATNTSNATILFAVVTGLRVLGSVILIIAACTVFLTWLHGESSSANERARRAQRTNYLHEFHHIGPAGFRYFAGNHHPLQHSTQAHNTIEVEHPHAITNTSINASRNMLLGIYRQNQHIATAASNSTAAHTPNQLDQSTIYYDNSNLDINSHFFPLGLIEEPTQNNSSTVDELPTSQLSRSPSSTRHRRQRSTMLYEDNATSKPAPNVNTNDLSDALDDPQPSPSQAPPKLLPLPSGMSTRSLFPLTTAPAGTLESHHTVVENQVKRVANSVRYIHPPRYPSYCSRLLFYFCGCYRTRTTIRGDLVASQLQLGPDGTYTTFLGQILAYILSRKYLTEHVVVSATNALIFLHIWVAYLTTTLDLIQNVIPIIFLSFLTLGFSHVHWNNLTAQTAATGISHIVLYILQICEISIIAVPRMEQVVMSQVRARSSTYDHILLLIVLALCYCYQIYATRFMIQTETHLSFYLTHGLEQNEKTYFSIVKQLLPTTLIQKYKQNSNLSIWQRHTSVTIMFIYINKFDVIAAKKNAQELVVLLNNVFSSIDVLTHFYRTWGAYKIETVGEVYMISSGSPYEQPFHADVMCDLAIDIINSIMVLFPQLEMKIGINSGPIVAGIIGIHYPRYRVIGDTVNTSSRMSSTTKPNTIQLSSSTMRRICSSAQLLLWEYSEGLQIQDAKITKAKLYSKLGELRDKRQYYELTAQLEDMNRQPTKHKLVRRRDRVKNQPIDIEMGVLGDKVGQHLTIIPGAQCDPNLPNEGVLVNQSKSHSVLVAGYNSNMSFSQKQLVSLLKEKMYKKHIEKYGHRLPYDATDSKQFNVVSLGEKEIKGKGKMVTWQLLGRIPGTFRRYDPCPQTTDYDNSDDDDDDFIEISPIDLFNERETQDLAKFASPGLKSAVFYLNPSGVCNGIPETGEDDEAQQTQTSSVEIPVLSYNPQSITQTSSSPTPPHSADSQSIPTANPVPAVSNANSYPVSEGSDNIDDFFSLNFNRIDGAAPNDKAFSFIAPSFAESTQSIISPPTAPHHLSGLHRLAKQVGYSQDPQSQQQTHADTGLKRVEMQQPPLLLQQISQFPHLQRSSSVADPFNQAPIVPAQTFFHDATHHHQRRRSTSTNNQFSGPFADGGEQRSSAVMAHGSQPPIDQRSVAGKRGSNKRSGRLHGSVYGTVQGSDDEISLTEDSLPSLHKGPLHQSHFADDDAISPPNGLPLNPSNVTSSALLHGAPMLLIDDSGDGYVHNYKGMLSTRSQLRHTLLGNEVRPNISSPPLSNRGIARHTVLGQQNNKFLHPDLESDLSPLLNDAVSASTDCGGLTSPRVDDSISVDSDTQLVAYWQQWGAAAGAKIINFDFLVEDKRRLYEELKLSRAPNDDQSAIGALPPKVEVLVQSLTDLRLTQPALSSPVPAAIEFNSSSPIASPIPQEVTPAVSVAPNDDVLSPAEIQLESDLQRLQKILNEPLDTFLSKEKDHSDDELIDNATNVQSYYMRGNETTLFLYPPDSSTIISPLTLEFYSGRPSHRFKLSNIFFRTARIDNLSSDHTSGDEIQLNEDGDHPSETDQLSDDQGENIGCFKKKKRKRATKRNKKLVKKSQKNQTDSGTERSGDSEVDDESDGQNTRNKAISNATSAGVDKNPLPEREVSMTWNSSPLDQALAIPQGQPQRPRLSRRQSVPDATNDAKGEERYSSMQAAFKRPRFTVHLPKPLHQQDGTPTFVMSSQMVKTLEKNYLLDMLVSTAKHLWLLTLFNALVAIGTLLPYIISLHHEQNETIAVSDLAFGTSRVLGVLITGIILVVLWLIPLITIPYISSLRYWLKGEQVYPALENNPPTHLVRLINIWKDIQLIAPNAIPPYSKDPEEWVEGTGVWKNYFKELLRLDYFGRLGPQTHLRYTIDLCIIPYYLSLFAFYLMPPTLLLLMWFMGIHSTPIGCLVLFLNIFSISIYTFLSFKFTVILNLTTFILAILLTLLSSTESGRAQCWYLVMTGFFTFLTMFQSYIISYNRRIQYIQSLHLYHDHTQSLTLFEKLLPQEILSTLDRRGQVGALGSTGLNTSSKHQYATVLFADVVAFTIMSAQLQSEELVLFLNMMFSVFDQLSSARGVYKVETIGDCYFACTNVVQSVRPFGVDPSAYLSPSEHAQNMVYFAMDIIFYLSLLPHPLASKESRQVRTKVLRGIFRALHKKNSAQQTWAGFLQNETQNKANVFALAKSAVRKKVANINPVMLRVGIHTGDVVAGVVGRTNPRYHIFGKTVSLSQKIESSGYPGRVSVSASTRNFLPSQWIVEYKKTLILEKNSDGQAQHTAAIQPIVLSPTAAQQYEDNLSALRQTPRHQATQLKNVGNISSPSTNVSSYHSSSARRKSLAPGYTSTAPDDGLMFLQPYMETDIETHIIGGESSPRSFIELTPLTPLPDLNNPPSTSTSASKGGDDMDVFDFLRTKPGTPKYPARDGLSLLDILGEAPPANDVTSELGSPNNKPPEEAPEEKVRYMEIFMIRGHEHIQRDLWFPDDDGEIWPPANKCKPNHRYW